MRAVLVPIKDPRNAKSRLSALLSAEERSRLAWAMFQDLSRELAGVGRADSIVIVTSYAPAIEHARASGWEVLVEESQSSESASVDWASHLLHSRCVKSVLRLPADLPLVRASDIDYLLALDEQARFCAMAPSRDGTGTNALLRSPANLFPSRFGPNSLALHKEQAARAGARCIVVENERLALDIDEPADIAAFLEIGARTKTLDVLAEMNVERRLAEARLEKPATGPLRVRIDK